MVQLLAHLVTEIVPMPVSPELDNDECIWTQALPQQEQLRAIHAVYAVLHLLGAMWQVSSPSLPRPRFYCLRTAVGC